MFTGVENHFLHNPVKVVIERPDRRNPTVMLTQLRVFLGDVPTRIVAAARSGNSAVLREFYGAGWRQKLGLGGAAGGKDIHGGTDDLDDIELLLSSTPTVAAAVVRSGAPVEYITDVHVFPEDKFTELREKIYIAADIPPYRQHLYWVADGRARAMYQLFADGVYSVDIRTLSGGTSGTSSGTTMAGLPIDKTLYDLRERIRVEAHDQFMILGDLADPTVYVRDLADYTTSHAQLAEIVNDTYRFDLLYYGFVIKYWPQLTQECFHDYVMRESELPHKYPDLAKSKTILANAYRQEAEIVTRDYRNATKALGVCSRITTAITQMTALVRVARTSINIRNLFDRLRTTRCVPEIHAYVERGGRRYLLRKRHIRVGADIQFPSGSLMKTGLTLAVSLRKADQDGFHQAKRVSTLENEQSRYLFLNIRPNGHYYIRTVWNEEDELGFDDIIRVMKRFTDKLISIINDLGKYVFIAGGPLPQVSKRDVSYQGLNICLFWKRVMLENTFKLVRAQWDQYIRARITAPRNVQQYDKYEFTFRKGMYQFDTGSIDRILSAANNTILPNQYAHLSSSIVKQKWDQNYDGRIVRMSHRTTDLRFEIIDVRETEFAIFHRYVAGFVYAASIDERIKASLTTTRSYKDVKKLRKLREQDPELFNLKKHGSKKVYSIICQNQRQPLIYTPDEIRDMSAGDVKRLTQYWNFTLNKPAYYGCPSKEYPHLSFMVGVHPRHYCLPCCNKRLQDSSDNRRSRLNALCLQKHKVAEDDVISDVDVSRHVMSYGKDTDSGRLSRVPASLVSLLFGTLGEHLQYYLFGVAQHTRGVENVGCLFAIAAAIGANPTELATRIIEDALPHFAVLLDGTLIEYFRDAQDFADTARDLFVTGSMFTREAQQFTQWPELIIEAAHLAGINVFTFIDKNGAGSAITLHVSGGLLADIMADRPDDTAGGGSVDSGAPATNIVILKRKNNYYPIFATDSDEYFRNGTILVRTYEVASPTVTLLKSMAKWGSRDEALEKVHDYGAIVTALADSPYRVIKKYVGRRNRCYGVEISADSTSAARVGSARAYVPIDYSTNAADGVPTYFGAVDRAGMSLSALLVVVALLNDRLPAIYRRIDISHRVNIGSTTVGALDGGLMYYWDDGSDASAPSDTSTTDVSVARYDYADVNAKILARRPPTPDARTSRLGEALYANHQYQLFLLEFVNYLNSERNETVRATLKTLIASTNFKRDLADFKRDLKAIVPASDLAVVYSQLGAFYLTLDRAQLFAQMDVTTYDFDRSTLNRLRAMTREDLLRELRGIADKFAVEKSLDVAAISFPNIYMPCGDTDAPTGYCDGARLIVNESLDTLVDLLSRDMMDSLKVRYLFDSADTTVDWLNFTMWPTEHITIYKLD